MVKHIEAGFFWLKIRNVILGDTFRWPCASTLRNRDDDCVVYGIVMCAGEPHNRA